MLFALISLILTSGDDSSCYVFRDDAGAVYEIIVMPKRLPQHDFTASASSPDGEITFEFEYDENSNCHLSNRVVLCTPLPSQRSISGDNTRVVTIRDRVIVGLDNDGPWDFAVWQNGSLLSFGSQANRNGPASWTFDLEECPCGN